ncbi:MAG TPA: PQQ-dependent sugar dehydrogenase [Kofleriaceae bacterium]|nr:PQQ-dependent sugar dehydrogenase [Kofleriaceae bacterium]
MRSTLWSAIAIASSLSCGSDGSTTGPAMPAPFGLDQRPANPTCVAKARPVVDTGVTLARQWSGITFSNPIYMTQAPGDDSTWYVVERGGKVRVVPTAATTAADVHDFVNVTVNTGGAGGEGGLLGMAFHPEWPTRREVYLSYTRTVVTGTDPAPPTCPNQTNPVTSVLARFKSTDNGATLDPAADEILKLGQPYPNHKGGNIQFGPDGFLYAGFGDGGSGNDPCGSGQDLGSLLGKFLRIDINAGMGAYNIPRGAGGNPFVGTPGAKEEIWSYGHRNPWRWSFDKLTGELWLGDVGQNTWEEIDLVKKGGNYGWNICEGFHKRGSTTELCNTPGLIDPVVEHDRSEAESITGGYVYRGTAMPSLVGKYIYGDFVTGNIWVLLFDASNKPVPTIIAHAPSNALASFAQGNDGEIYTVELTTGVISKLVPAAPPVADNFPKHLSETGCVDPSDPSKPAPGLIPYDVSAPLWSDGAEKQRYFALPDGATIQVTADNDLDLPIGSVAMKTFSVGGQRVETRLFMRHDDGGWAGYTYEWNEAGTDADLLPAGKAKPVGDQVWAYPSRNQCMQCHSLAAGGTIGLEIAQLNRDFVYPATHRQSNQLATLEHIGVFAAPLVQAPDAAPRLSDPAGNDSLEARARSYLHGNCSHCHRPMGGGQGTMDLRYAQTFKDTATCNADNTQGTVEGATKLIVPGSPDMSILSLRLHATDSKRMPPVAVSVTDPLGTQVIDDWITSLTACP